MEDFLRLAQAELEAAEREIADVRAILAEAVARLLDDVRRRNPDGPGRDALTALQFQDISDQLLVHALGRIASVRTRMRGIGAGQACGGAFMPGPARPVLVADLAPGSVELF